MNPCPWSIIRNFEAILEDSDTRDSLDYKAKGRSARANRVTDNVGIAANSLSSTTVGSSCEGLLPGVLRLSHI